ncbi:hypothetical protein QTP81_09435 [Alteromonas sp. ASW11-36]|uniref:Prepilin-type N-terminal cleavage/methylation domain-containing protein n=1 Tax=Alteromonas arenosi TaxID=3055817 RepID=A0ABT7SXA2_9ALTE|nr:hypothetical protein [Alteromonas sp. ASW11-36]MDM7860816.1 hypothetical protein [Alteromonas sp. ASW11-36]
MRGFALVEVIVVALIVMIGVTGYVTLQSEYVRSDSSMNLRTVAMELAQEKLDDLRQFEELQTTAGAIAFNDIADNQGGAIAAGPTNIAIKTAAGQTHTFVRSWQVVDQYFVDTNADGTADTWLNAGNIGLPLVLPNYPTQKAVTVSVSYVGADGDAKVVSVDGNIAPIPVGRSFQANTETDNAKRQPQVSYTPGAAPDVIAYDLGNNEKIETSKPVPDIDNQGENNVVQFETIRYLELLNQTDKLEQEEFLTVNCTCALAGNGKGYTAAMTVLQNGELVVQQGEEVTKMTGVPANNQQPALCTQCCRDHHDTATTIANENYYRSENGGPHKHYFRDNSGNYSLASGIGDKYHEACRFKRVNGFFTLYPDWQLIDIVEFDDSFLFTGSNLTAYTNYSENVIESEITGSARPAKLAGRDLTVLPGGYQLISRGIYLDRMTSAHKATVKAMITAGDPDWIAFTPFYDINLTLLSDWYTTTPIVATVTQEDIETIVDPVNDFYGTYSRGRLEALTDGVTKVAVQGYAYNSSITGTGPISPSEKAGIRIDDSITVTVDSKAGTEKFYGLVVDINCIITFNGVPESCETNNTKKASYVDLTALVIEPNPNNFTCTVDVPKGKSTPFMNCENVSENYNGYIDFTFAKAGYTTVMKIRLPDGSVVTTNRLDLSKRLTATSNREFALIIELVPN